MTSSDVVEKIARAVLYEGYMLYPYRESALKNQQRWNFGVLYPPAWAVQQTGSSDRSYFQMECVAQDVETGTFDVSARFLQLMQRRSGERDWQEAVEQKISVKGLVARKLTAATHVEAFVFPGDHAVDGRVEISAEELHQGIHRLTVRVTNTSAVHATTRNEALLHSLASAHAVMTLHGGQFVSQIDPPDPLRDAVAACQNIGVWPVLVGDADAHDTMLGAPIILYDFPQIAPESKGDLFDSTEIDEILILRILTLSDSEKDEIRRSDERARRILERLESSPQEHLMELHGRLSKLEPAAFDRRATSPYQKGDRVRLCPKKRADIFDTVLEGKIAIVEAVEEDFEGNIHLAVTIEDDPGRDLGEMRQIGHRFFYSLTEVKPVNNIAST
ncbi:MAG TPA: hypothetical protein VH302_05245 [Bryobacteraceae bacterium]|nr:hypothetical protein [Bryobacteraceae bacterium]